MKVIVKSRLPHTGDFLSAVLSMLAVVLFALFAVEHGFEQPPLSLHWLTTVQVLTLVVYIAYRVRASQNQTLSQVFSAHRMDLFLALVVGGTALIRSDLRAEALAVAALYAGLLRLGSLAGWSLDQLIGDPAQPSRTVHPSRMMLLSFVTLIAVGTALLSLPRAMSTEKRLETGHYASKQILNNAFMATSATCVVGLAVYDISTDYSLFGQVIILLLIQLGGLGIMLFSAIFGLLLRKQLTLRETLFLQDTYSHQTLGQISSIVKFICISTLVLEGIGALILYSMWPADVSSVSMRWFYSVFHAISAFCNAGLTLQSDSLMSYHMAWQVYGSIMPLIILGGLGFPVLADMWQYGRRRLFPGRLDNPLVQPRLSLHTKLVLVMSIVLTIVPTALMVFFEANYTAAGEHSLATGSSTERSLGALFRVVNCRTAGFNVASTSLDDMAPASLFLMCILMFIGGSPASTAGGVKTVAIAVLLLGIAKTLRRRESVEVFNRQIGTITVQQSATIVFVMFCLISSIMLVLNYTESASLAEVLFETVSACGTVGLSTGLTVHLTITGKIVIMLAMLAGRLGPLTLLVALASQPQEARYDYPTEQVSLG